MRNRLVFVASLLFAFSLSFAQERFPDDGILYNGNSVGRVDISIHPDSLELILASGNEESDHEFPAVFTFTRGAFTETIDSVGFRLRGNTSRYSAKKSFKVSMNTFIRGQKFAGVEKINLNGEHNDPSIARALTCWHLFREAGVPAPRSGHVELYINDEYRGIYLNVEHIDEEFTRLRFGNNDGNMYKCLWPADLVWLGDDPDLYKYDNNGRRAYELKRNEEQDDYSDLAHFIEILNLTEPGAFPEKLEPVFNVNIYLKNLAIEILSGHWDAYAYNKNNYYLYNNESTGKFEFIPYDPDNTMGISWWDVDWTQEDIYSWYTSGDERPLTKRLLENSTYRDRFSFYMDRYLTEFFNSTYLDPFVESIRARIAPFAEDDLYRTYDYGFDMDDFNNSYEQAWGAHVREGIKPYISKRSASAASQVTVNEIAPIITLLYRNEPDFYEDLLVRALVEDESTPSEVKVYYSDDGDFASLNMNLLENDEYIVYIPGLDRSGTISYYIEATDVNQNVSRDPYTGYYTYTYGTVSTAEQAMDRGSVLKVFPNPASGHLFIDGYAEGGSGDYRLLDLSGKIVIAGTLNGNAPSRIDLPEALHPGLYILETTLPNTRPARTRVLIIR